VIRKPGSKNVTNETVLEKKEKGGALSILKCG
jgi:hypothetical protein